MSMIVYIFSQPCENKELQWSIDAAKPSEQVRKIYTKKSLFEIYETENTRFRIIGKYRGYLIRVRQSIQAIIYSKPGDVVVCWEHGTGIIFNALSMLLGNRRRIVICQWLSPGNKGFRRKYKALVKKAALNPMCKNVINMKSAVERWSNYFSVELNNFYYLPDVYSEDITFCHPSLNAGYCFTGGVNNRDWKLVTELARVFRKIRFVCCALQTDFKDHVCLNEIPPNMELYFNVKHTKYYDLMKEARLILLPLKDNQVSGLVNILAAAEMGILCATSEYEFTEGYYEHGSRLLLADNELETWEQMIAIIYEMDADEYIEQVIRFQNYIKGNFSPAKGIKDLKKIIYEEPI